MLERAAPLRKRHRGRHPAPACAVLDFHILFSKEDISAGIRLIVAQSRRKSSDAVRALSIVFALICDIQCIACLRMRHKSETKRHSPNEKKRLSTKSLCRSIKPTYP